MNYKYSKGQKPEILSPKRGLSYTRRTSSEDNLIVFLGQVDGGVKKVFWYLGETYLGDSTPTKPLYWNSKPGNYLVKLVDDHGRKTTRNLKVTLIQ
jgi:penicillin-binding protein 1C